MGCAHSMLHFPHPAVKHLKLFIFALLFISVALSATVDPKLFSELKWRAIGPFRGGRTRALAGVPGQPNVFYIGAVNGGVWKTNDFGRTWKPIFDDQPTGSIGAIAIAPSDPNIIYVGSGEGLAAARSYRSATAFTNPPMRAKPGRISGCATASRFRRSWWIRAIPTGCSSRCSGIPMVRTKSAASFARPMAARHSRRFCTRTRTPARNDVEMDPVESRYRLCRDVGSAAGSVGERRVGRHERRHFQIHGRRQDVAAADQGSAGGWRGAGQSRDRAEQSASASTPPSPTRAASGIYRSDDARRELGASDHRCRGPRRASAAAICPVPGVDPKNPDMV